MNGSMRDSAPCSGPLVAHDDVVREVPGAGAGDGAEEFVDVVGVGVAPAVPGGQKAIMDQPACQVRKHQTRTTNQKPLNWTSMPHDRATACSGTVCGGRPQQAARISDQAT